MAEHAGESARPRGRALHRRASGEYPVGAQPRASGEGRLRKGRRAEEFTAAEVADEDELPLLRAYLTKWAWEVGAFFEGVGADAPDDDLRRIAPLHPIFRIARR